MFKSPRFVTEEPVSIHRQMLGHDQTPLLDRCDSDFRDQLASVSAFHVKQEVELLEAAIGIEIANRYSVHDQANNRLFYVGERSNCIARQLFKGHRPFMLTVKDRLGREVLVMQRDINCSLWGLFCPDKIRVSTPTGLLLGWVVEKISFLYPKLSVQNAFNESLLDIEGPLITMACGPCAGPVTFQVNNLAGVGVGRISKNWSGWMREVFSSADNFSATFPLDLDQSLKAVLLAALFLIDFEYYERR